MSHRRLTEPGPGLIPPLTKARSAVAVKLMVVKAFSISGFDMWFENTLRQTSVGRRLAIAVAVLVLPMSVLIAASVVVVQQQEFELHSTIEEAVNKLVPLTTLEYDLQRALTDELAAETGENIPDFGGLTNSIDRLFLELGAQSEGHGVNADLIVSARNAWRSARPAIDRLVEHVTPLHVDGHTDAGSATRAELTETIRDIDAARLNLTAAVKMRAKATATAQHRQLRLLMFTWAGTLALAAVLMSAIVYSIVKPTREISNAIRQLSSGDLSVRIDSRPQDELGVIAAHVNAMAEWFDGREKMLEGEALQDPLTGLPNRRGIVAALEAQLIATRQSKVAVSVLMIDVDRFKQVNDRFGHSVGDQALVWLANTMRDALRSGDMLGRYAGDEFLAVLPDAPNTQAREVAERLCQTVRDAAQGDAKKPSVTVGVATRERDDDTAELLVHVADQALYQGKRAGRARVAVR